MNERVIEDFMSYIDGKRGSLSTLDGLVSCYHSSEVVEFRSNGAFLEAYATLEYGGHDDVMDIIRKYVRPYLMADTIDESHKEWRSMTQEIKNFKFKIAMMPVHIDSISCIEYINDNIINLYSDKNKSIGFKIFLRKW